MDEEDHLGKIPLRSYRLISNHFGTRSMSSPQTEEDNNRYSTDQEDFMKKEGFKENRKHIIKDLKVDTSNLCSKLEKVSKISPNYDTKSPFLKEHRKKNNIASPYGKTFMKTLKNSLNVTKKDITFAEKLKMQNELKNAKNNDLSLSNASTNSYVLNSYHNSSTNTSSLESSITNESQYKYSTPIILNTKQYAEKNNKEDQSSHTKKYQNNLNGNIQRTGNYSIVRVVEDESDDEDEVEVKSIKNVLSDYINDDFLSKDDISKDVVQIKTEPEPNKIKHKKAYKESESKVKKQDDNLFLDDSIYRSIEYCPNLYDQEKNNIDQYKFISEASIRRYQKSIKEICDQHSLGDLFRNIQSSVVIPFGFTGGLQIVGWTGRHFLSLTLNKESIQSDLKKGQWKLWPNSGSNNLPQQLPFSIWEQPHLLYCPRSHSLFLFGGICNNNSSLMYQYDLIHNKWQRLDKLEDSTSKIRFSPFDKIKELKFLSDNPSIEYSSFLLNKRFDEKTSQYEDYLIVYGGLYCSKIISNTIYEYNIKKMEWKILTQKFDTQSPKWILDHARRFGHSAVMKDSSNLIVYGGVGGGVKPYILQTMMKFSLKTYQWSSVLSKNEKNDILYDEHYPGPLCYHSAEMLPHVNSMLIYGGVVQTKQYSTQYQRNNDLYNMKMFSEGSNSFLSSPAWKQINQNFNGEVESNSKSGMDSLDTTPTPLGYESSPGFDSRDVWNNEMFIFNFNNNMWTRVVIDLSSILTPLCKCLKIHPMYDNRHPSNISVLICDGQYEPYQVEYDYKHNLRQEQFHDVFEIKIKMQEGISMDSIQYRERLNQFRKNSILTDIVITRGNILEQHCIETYF